MFYIFTAEELSILLFLIATVILIITACIIKIKGVLAVKYEIRNRAIFLTGLATTLMIVLFILSKTFLCTTTTENISKTANIPNEHKIEIKTTSKKKQIEITTTSNLQVQSAKASDSSSKHLLLEAFNAVPDNLLLVILLVPVAWLLWIWRNYDKEKSNDNAEEQIKLQREKNTIDNFLSFSQLAGEKTNSDGVRSAALIRMKEYLAGQNGENFAVMAMSFMKDFLLKRSVSKILKKRYKNIDSWRSPDFNNELEELRTSECFSVTENLMTEALVNGWLKRSSRYGIFEGKEVIQGFDFSGMIFENVVFPEGLIFHKCNFDFVQLVRTSLTCAKFFKCSFDGALFVESELRNAEFLGGIKFQKTYFSGHSDFSNSSFDANSNFLQSSFGDVVFSGTTFGRSSNFKASCFWFTEYPDRKTIVSAIFQNCKWYANCNFSDVSFYHDVKFDGSCWGVGCNFTNAKIVDHEDNPTNNGPDDVIFYNPKGCFIRAHYPGQRNRPPHNTHVYYGYAALPGSEEEYYEEQYMEQTTNSAKAFADGLFLEAEANNNIPDDYK